MSVNPKDLAAREARLAAIAANKNKYHGSPCKQCQSTLKYVRASSCVKCTQRRTNERDASIGRKWAQSSKGKIKLHIRVRGQKYKDMQKRWRQSIKGAAYKRREAIERYRCLTQVTLNKDELAQVKVIYEHAVYLTRTTDTIYHVDHIMPLAKGGLHHPDNLQILTEEDNLAKKAMLPEEWNQYKLLRERRVAND